MFKKYSIRAIVHDTPASTVCYSPSKDCPRMRSRACIAAFLFVLLGMLSLGSSVFTSVILSSGYSSHSSGYSRFKGRLTIFFVGNNTFAALISPSLFGISSTIIATFHQPLGRSSLTWTMFPTVGNSLATTRPDFNLICDRSRRFNK